MRSLCEYPDWALGTVSPDVEKMDSFIRDLIVDMKTVCNQHKSLGLAANQVGVNYRILVYRVKSGELETLINPVIVDMLPVMDPQKEGCLSLTGLYLNTFRSTEIEVSGLNEQFEPVTLIAENREARIIQHEIDHLDGILIVDKLSKLNRMMTLEKYMKRRKAALRRAA